MSKQIDIRFCYLISADAGLAYDTETGEKTELYSQIKLNGAKNPPSDYRETHERMGKALAEQYGLKPEWITPISTEQYDRESDVEEVEHG